MSAARKQNCPDKSLGSHTLDMAAILASRLDHHLAPGAQVRKPLPESRENRFRLLDPFILRADVAGVWRDALPQSFHGALRFLVELRGQGIEQVSPQGFHLFLELVLCLFTLVGDHKKTDDRQGARRQDPGDIQAGR